MSVCVIKIVLFHFRWTILLISSVTSTRDMLWWKQTKKKKEDKTQLTSNKEVWKPQYDRP